MKSRWMFPFRNLTAAQQDLIIEGDPKSGYNGVNGFFQWLERKKYKLHVRVFLSRYRGYAICPECHGARLRAEARAVRVSGKSITEVCAMTVAQARQFVDSLELSAEQAAIADKILEEIRQRLLFLDEVGLDYLSLDRLASTLSGGEAQRIQLATSLGSHLVGALYVLDEPSIGLHPRDTHRLIDILKSLRDLGNTILVVEHDPDTIAAADYVIDLGPGAGEHGGKLLFAGPRSELLQEPRIAHRAIPERRTAHSRPDRAAQAERAVSANLRSARAQSAEYRSDDSAAHAGGDHGRLGIGKIHAGARRDLQGARSETHRREHIKELCDRIEGEHLLQSVVLVDQSPIGRTPRSNPSTYLKAFDAIREVFAATPEAKKRGYTAGHFSFNIPGGRCEACQGEGIVTVEMQFLADVELICEECRGTRFKSGVLEVRYREKNVHEVLQLTVREALVFFAGVPKITSKLRILDEVGLGYLRLGQSATTLSGGEAQRLKLAAHLTTQANEGVLYIFDEPTTGLHFDDIQKLLTAFRKLIDGGRVDSGHRAQSRHHQVRGLDHRSGPGRRGAGRAGCGHGNARAGGAQFAFIHGKISFARACEFPRKS